MSSRTLAMTDTLHAYLLATSVRDTPALDRLRQETAALGGIARMQISPEQGQLMAFLVETLGARRLLEVGTFTGYSALVCALALPADGRIVCCDVSREWTDIARRHWQDAGVAERIDLRLGPALETLDGLLAAGAADSFDMAFIDADKTNYDGYYERCLRLVRPGGVIGIDNTLWSGRVADPADTSPDTAALRALNAKIGRDDRVAMVQIPIGDGYTLARRRS
jgi:predicted O-methyltransferase YrrM